APADLAAGPDYTLYENPAVALDASGHGIAIWREVLLGHNAQGCLDHSRDMSRIRYSVWDGFKWSPSEVLAGSEQSTATSLHKPPAFPFTTREVTAAKAQIRQQAIAVWEDSVKPGGKLCSTSSTEGSESWPHYSVWDGNTFGGVDILPGPVADGKVPLYVSPT